MRIVLLGGTHLTLACAEAVEEHVVGVISVPEVFEISFSTSALTNAKFAPVSGWAAERELPALVWSGPDAAIDFVRETRAEWGLAAGWYHYLPRRLLAALPRGVAGIHASSLPRYRGNSPLNWTILNGEITAGVSLFQMSEGLDEGQLYGQRSFPIGQRPVIADLVEQSTQEAVALVAQAVGDMTAGRLELHDQEGVPSYALARVPSDGLIDWSADTQTIDRLVRATGAPYPGAFTTLAGDSIRVWSGNPVEDLTLHGAAGQLWRFGARLLVVTGDGAFEMTNATTDDGADALQRLRSSSQLRLGS